LLYHIHFLFNHHFSWLNYVNLHFSSGWALVKPIHFPRWVCGLSGLEATELLARVIFYGKLLNLQPKHVETT
jgi:hypothetical protein